MEFEQLLSAFGASPEEKKRKLDVEEKKAEAALLTAKAQIAQTQIFQQVLMERASLIPNTISMLLPTMLPPMSRASSNTPPRGYASQNSMRPLQGLSQNEETTFPRNSVEDDNMDDLLS